MQSVKIFKAALSSGLIMFFLCGMTSSSLAADGKIIAKCSLVEKRIVKTVGFESKARELQWQVNRKAKKYPWVQTVLAINPDRVLPEIEMAPPENAQKAEKAVLATMQFNKEDERPFSGGKVALGDIALAVYPRTDTPIRYAVKKMSGKVLITHRQAPEQPTVQLTYNMNP